MHRDGCAYSFTLRPIHDLRKRFLGDEKTRASPVGADQAVPIVVPFRCDRLLAVIGGGGFLILAAILVSRVRDTAAEEAMAQPV